MKQLHITNLTMNSNLAIYIGAYIDSIHRLAILNTNVAQTILYIIPYLKQMHIAYKIYTDEMALIQDINCFRPNAILSNSKDMIHHTILNKLIDTLKIDVIVVNYTISLPANFQQDNWYGVSIYNPATTQTTYLYHTNDKINIPPLTRLNDYSSIHVESLPEMS